MSYNAATKTMTFGPAGKASASATKSKPRASKKATVVEDVQDKTQSKFDETYANFERLFDFNVDIKYPVIGMVVNLVTTGLGLYTGIQAAAWLGFGAAVFTGSMFIGYVVAFIAGFMLTIQALRFGAAAGSYMATGKFEHDYQRAKNWISNKFAGITKRSVAQGADHV